MRGRPLPKRKWNKRSIQALILKNREAVEKAVLTIYSNQTIKEQERTTVINKNDKGFLPYDVKRGSYWALWIKSGKHLTGKHLYMARERMVHYHRQIVEAIPLKQNPILSHKRQMKLVKVA